MKQIRDFSLSEQLSHSVIAQICLAYLLQFNTCEPLDINLDVSSPLAKYAAEHWIIHAYSGCKNKSLSSSVSALIMKLLTDDNGAFANFRVRVSRIFKNTSVLTISHLTGQSTSPSLSNQKL